MPGKIKEAVTSWRVSYQWRLNSHSDLFFLQEMCASYVCLAREKVIFQQFYWIMELNQSFAIKTFLYEKHHASYNIVLLVVLFAQGNLRKRAAKRREAWDGKLIETNRSPGARFVVTLPATRYYPECIRTVLDGLWWCFCLFYFPNIFLMDTYSNLYF